MSTPATIPAMVQAAAVEHRQREAVVDGARRVTYQQLGDLALRATSAALASGITPGDRVGVWAPNGLDWIVASLGVQGAGAALVPISTRLRGDEAADVLTRSKATMLFVVGEFLGVDYPAMLGAADPALVERLDLVSIGHLDGFLARGRGVEAAEAARAIAAVPGDAVSDIMFTSGTTGRPKGVVLTHAQALRSFASFNEGFGLRPDDRYLVVNPFSHSFGYKAGWMLSFMVGATIVPLARFDADTVLEVIEQERITVYPGPPTLMSALLDHPRRDQHDLSSLRLAMASAANVPPDLVRRLHAELFDTVVASYGLTEATAMATVSRPGDPLDVIATAVGRPIDGVEVRVVDDDDTMLPAGERGELWIRGFNVMQGYLDDAAATAAAITADGWLRTGDVATLDGDGNVRIVDRKKHMIIVGGFNVYPAEVERDLLRSGLISDVAVVGVPDERLGEVAVAFVVAPRGGRVDVAALERWARAHMATFKVPRRFEILDAVPRNASNKVLKAELRRR